MECVRATGRQEDEFEYMCALYGSPFGAATVGAIFGGVVERDGLGGTILVLYYWERQMEERVTRVRGGGEEQSVYARFWLGKILCIPLLLTGPPKEIHQRQGFHYGAAASVAVEGTGTAHPPVAESACPGASRDRGWYVIDCCPVVVYTAQASSDSAPERD